MVYTKKIGVDNQHPATLEIRTDCKSIIDHLRETKGITEEGLLVDIEIIKQLVRDGATVNWVPTQAQLADHLTKSMVPKELYKVLDTGRMGELSEGSRSVDMVGVQKKRDECEDWGGQALCMATYLPYPHGISSADAVT